MRFIIYLIGIGVGLYYNNIWITISIWIWGEIIFDFIISIIKNTTTKNDPHENANTSNNKTETIHNEDAFQEAYMILGVEKTASDGDIKNAYRKLALTYHPDVCSDSEAASKFRSINEAYETVKKLRGLK